MSSVIKLNHIDLALTDSPREHLAFFKRNIEKLQEESVAIDSIVIASSSELTFLSNKHCHEILRELLTAFPEAKSEIICQGCLGFYASALHFLSQKSYQSTLFVIIDAPQEVHQIGLNTVKLGICAGQDGMVARPGVGIFTLERKNLETLAPNDMIIDYIDIIAKTGGLDANAVFVKRIVKNLITLLSEQPAQLVSFDIGAKIAQLCKMYLKPALASAGFDSPWLPSFEQDNHHVFSLKQLHELLAYQQELENKPLVFPALGVGGRFGIMRVTTSKHFKASRFPDPVCIEWPFVEFFQNSVAVMKVKRNEKAFYKKAQEVMVTIHDCHLIDNLYFRWVIQLSDLYEIEAFSQPAMASIIDEPEQELADVTP